MRYLGRDGRVFMWYLGWDRKVFNGVFGVTSKNSSVPAKLPPKTLVSRPSYIIKISLKLSQKRPCLHCSVLAEIPHKNSSVPAEIPPKNSSVPAEIPPKTLLSRPRYLLSFLLYCSFPDNTGVFKCIIMTNHLVLAESKHPFIPRNCL